MAISLICKEKALNRTKRRQGTFRSFYIFVVIVLGPIGEISELTNSCKGLCGKDIQCNVVLVFLWKNILRSNVICCVL